MTTLVWFREDLRLADNAALAAAAKDPGGIVALYVLDEQSPGTRPLGGAARWWLHESLRQLSAELRARGIPLILRRGRSEQVVTAMATECGATRVLWNRRYGSERQLDAQIKTRLRARGVEARSFPGRLLFEPGTVLTGAGTPYRVYSAFWRACLLLPAPAAPLPTPDNLRAADTQPSSEPLESWQLQPQRPNWAAGLAERWSPGEAAANRHGERFISQRVNRYAQLRDFPAEDAGSELSPYLRWGEISPRTLWHRILTSPVPDTDRGKFLSELGWREFAAHTAFYHPQLNREALDRRFAAFPWREPDPAELSAWRTGQTGFAIVDAGMRELWRTGFMHNRVRMIVASFLTKNLLTHWRMGEAWFWDTLVDADPASNPFNWQWVAGCGADAAPYFRIFNPVTQQHKFDPSGQYVTRWAPDSGNVPELVDVRSSRARALAAFDDMRRCAG